MSFTWDKVISIDSLIHSSSSQNWVNLHFAIVLGLILGFSNFLPNKMENVVGKFSLAFQSMDDWIYGWLDPWISTSVDPRLSAWPVNFPCPRVWVVPRPIGLWPHFSKTRTRSVPSSILSFFFISSLDVGLGHWLYGVKHLPHQWSMQPGGLGINFVTANTVMFHDQD